MIRARIIANIANQYWIANPTIGIQEARAMGKLRLDKTPIVGDFVEISDYDGIYGIERILKRHNQLKRPQIANVDQALLLMSTQNPNFSSLVCDRLLFQVLLEDIEPIIIFTKMDLLAHDGLQKYIDDYRQSGYQVFLLDKTSDLTLLKTKFKDKVSVLVGNSGVGKSTLLNRLDSTLQLRTQEISKALNRGKHTTTNTKLYAIADGYVADTPGFASLTLNHIAPLTLAWHLAEFKPHLTCKFSNCLHESEPACGIKEAVAKGALSAIRYQNYLTILKECKEN